MTDTKLRTFLWFDDRLEEALDFYKETFGNVIVHSEFRQELDQPLFTADFSIYGHEFAAMNWAGSEGFTNAVSFSLNIDGQAETDRRDEERRRALGRRQVVHVGGQTRGDGVGHLAQERRVGEEPELVEVGRRALPRGQDEVAVDLRGRDDAPCEVVAHGWVA